MRKILEAYFYEENITSNLLMRKILQVEFIYEENITSNLFMRKILQVQSVMLALFCCYCDKEEN